MATSYNPKVVTEGLSMYVDFSNPRTYISGSTTVYDLVSPITGSIAGGGPIYQVYSNSIDFVQNYRVPIPTNQNSWTQGTFIAWVKLPSSSVINVNKSLWGTFEGGSWGFQLIGIDSNGLLHAQNGKGGAGPMIVVSSSINVNDGNWHMITYQYSVGDKLYLYVDMDRTDGPTFPSKGAQSTSSYIASSYNGEGRISGSIGTVLWYDRMLSNQEILQIYNVGRAKYGV